MRGLVEFAGNCRSAAPFMDADFAVPDVYRLFGFDFGRNKPCRPFDLPEGESEITGGFMVEYSAMAFALFFLGEYSAMILMSAMTTVLFLGGWLPPFGIEALAFVPGIVWFAMKTMLIMFVFLWARATLPRFRYDQLMRLGWKVFLPLTLFWVVLTAGLLLMFVMLCQIRRRLRAILKLMSFRIWMPNQSRLLRARLRRLKVWLRM